MYFNEKLEAMISLYLEANHETREAALNLMTEEERIAFQEAVSWRLLMTDSARYKKVMAVLLRDFMGSVDAV